jgi:hypothetical protein
LERWLRQKQQLSLNPQLGQMVALPPLRSGMEEPQTGQGISLCGGVSSRETLMVVRSSTSEWSADEVELAGWLDMRVTSDLSPGHAHIVL